MPTRPQLLLAGLLVIAAAAEARSLPDEVRVRLFESVAPQALAVSTNRGLLFLAGDGSGEVLAEVPPYEKATIRREGTSLRVSFRETTFRARVLRLIPRDEALLNVEVLEGKRAHKPRRYPGRLNLAADDGAPALMVVNHVLLDEYVACVVSSEYGFDDLEGAKAMAVLARTYVLRNAASGGAYDLVDHQLAQQYDGADRLTDAAIEATIATLGEVLTYQGTLVEAVYFSSSGGHTANNDAVWNGKALPYLRGVPDPYDEASPHKQWRTTVPRDRLLRTLSTRYNTAIDGFEVGRRSRSGRVKTIELMHQNQTVRTIASNEFRLLVNQTFGITSLKSTLFDVQQRDEQYVFEGRGFGHGVGMSQYGALGMSKQGFGYRDILSFYFTGTQVQRWR